MQDGSDTCMLLLKPSWHTRIKEVGLHGLAVACNHLAITADEEFAKVPFYGTIRCIAGKSWRSAAQELVDRLSVWTIDISAFHQAICWQAVLTDVEIRYLAGSTWFLGTELIARKEE